MPRTNNEVEISEIAEIVHELERVTTSFNRILEVMRDNNLEIAWLQWTNAHKEAVERLSRAATSGRNEIESQVTAAKLKIPSQAERAKLKSEKNRIRQRRKLERENAAAGQVASE